jgi:hypothetical protein
MVAASRPAPIQLEVSIVPALKDTNCKWTTQHVKVGLLLDHSLELKHSQPPSVSEV